MNTKRPLIMGVLNVTPDSFHDGGSYHRSELALARGFQLVAEGADWIDVGGESTRPGAPSVPIEEQIKRVVPVIRALREYIDTPISVDTSNAEVARAALNAGANGINDITALSDSEMLPLAVEYQCDLFLMHMKGIPLNMQINPSYQDVVLEVCEYLKAKADFAIEAGVPKKKIWVDPGIGFGKTQEHNLTLIRELPRLVSMGYSVLVGASRKSFIGSVLNQPSTVERLEGSLAVASISVFLGASMMRVHDVSETRRVVDMAWALKG